MKILHEDRLSAVPGNAQAGISAEGTWRVGEEIVMLFIPLTSGIWVKQLNKTSVKRTSEVRDDIVPGRGQERNVRLAKEGGKN